MIKFVAPSKAPEGLLSLHKQFPCSNEAQYGIIPFVHFQGSIPDIHERLAWTTAHLLPSWAVPGAQKPKLKALGVLPNPSLYQVISHVTNLTKNLLKDVDREMPQPKRPLLVAIMTEVYTFLQHVSKCQEMDSLDSCSQVCLEIGNLLCDNSCILVEDGRVFVRGDQLAFQLNEQLAPYMYEVPREYGPFEHLFKRLGAE
ncbi:sacsin-like [Stylophora pistillata]|uniref:sacsin-like n=1 Tax=Stylophora pistillata TaxID=50429 RepID=UPI000C04CB5E|nr:sacsin-like [Stylophora pistillata]